MGNNKCKVVGLTGPTGAGKTNISQVFKDQGFILINADSIAKEILEHSQSCKEKLTQAFGNNIIDDKNKVNKKILAMRAFKNNETVEVLNQITHPYIIDEIKKQIKKNKLNGEDFILLDAPLLFECGLDSFCDSIVLVNASSEIRLKRIMARDKISSKAALERMKVQVSAEEYLKKVDYILINDGNKETLTKNAINLVLKIKGDFS